MRQLLAIFVALWSWTNGHAAAGAIPLWAKPRGGPAAPEHSAGLFVGVREFKADADKLAEVPYAVDDAVDLAYALSLDSSPRLLDTPTIVLALSGQPQKSSSQKRLQALEKSGAKIEHATQSDIFKLLDRQAGAVGKDGILIVAFATHGVSDGNVQYLFTESSLLKYNETAISEQTIREIVSLSGAPRALILFDACRERLKKGPRAAPPDPRSAAAFLRALGNFDGQVVISAAAAGKYAYDDEARQNGVFTAAVIDGLHCGAAVDEHGFVTVDTLQTFVEERVLQWIRKHREPGAVKATQIESEGRSKMMPLAVCVSGKVAAAPRPAP